MIELGQTPTDDEIYEMIKEVDSDGNGEIDFDEFLIVMSRKMKDTDTEEEFIRGFQVFDADSDEKISKDDLRALMKNLGEDISEEELDDMIKVATTEGTSTVNFDEFRAVLQNK